MDEKKTIRLFPRRTKATPVDPLAIVNRGPYLWDEADQINISVSFEWDKPQAEKLANEWQCVTSHIALGGPAYGDPGGPFEPGKYLKNGYTITTRGCVNKCWFCQAWRHEGALRELPIKPGHIVQDNNLLAASDSHIKAVFEMLKTQQKTPIFAGGLEARRIKNWHLEYLKNLKAHLWFAYDGPADYEPLRSAAQLLRSAGILKNRHNIGCYVLCGFNSHGHKDSFPAAYDRLCQVARLGLMPFAMLYNRGLDWPELDRAHWVSFARSWANPVIVGGKMKTILNK